ncbi:MAG: hypothetical protein ABEH78_03155 [Haloferacaceae archaeon]
MARETGSRRTPTRRAYLTCGDAVIGGTLLAGCTGAGDSPSTTAGPSKPSDTSATARTTTGEDEADTGTMESMGDVSFESVPETFGVGNGLDTLADEDARLFDYERVADVINGAI